MLGENVRFVAPSTTETGRDRACDCVLPVALDARSLSPAPSALSQKTPRKQSTTAARSLPVTVAREGYS